MFNKNRIGARIPESLRERLEEEANNRGSNITDVLVEKIELGYETEAMQTRFNELKDEIKHTREQQKTELEKFKADVLPDIRRTQNIVFWILTTLSEFAKASVGQNTFYSIKERVEAKYEEFKKDKKITL